MLITDSFSISEVLVQKKAKENLENNLPQLASLDLKRRDLTVLLENPGVILEAKQAAVIKDRQVTDTFFRVTSSHAIRFATSSRVHAYGIVQTIYRLEVQTSEGQHLLQDTDPTDWSSFENQDPTIKTLVEASSEKEVRFILQKWFKATKYEYDEMLRKVQENKSDRAQWGFFDFCYFSTVTMATVGYGDMVPNSSWIRLVVMIEAILGVSYITFGITFLWPQVK